MLSFLSRKTRQAVHALGVREGRAQQHREDLDRRESYRKVEMERHIGAPVIVVPNEWDNPIIGFGKCLQQVGHSWILVIDNYVTSEEVFCGGVMMDFSDQRLEIVLALDPFQLWAITAHNSVGYEDFSKPKSCERWERQTILHALEKNGFFIRWAEFKEKERQENERLMSECEPSP